MLTDREVQGLKARKVRYEIRDSKKGGLIVRVTPAGKRVLGCWFRTPARTGRDVRGFITIGVYPSTSLADARAHADKIRGWADKGLDPRKELAREQREALAAERAAEDLTVAKLVGKRLEDIAATLKPSTREQYAWVYATIRQSEIADTPLLEVKREEIKKLLKRLYSERGPGVARKVRTMLRGTSRWALENATGIDRDALEGLRFAEAEPKVGTNVLGDEQIAALWRACDDLPPVMAASIRLQLTLALRHPSETTGMRWGDLRRQTVAGVGAVMVYTLPPDRRKHDVELVLPLPPLAVEVIEGMRPLTGNRENVLDGWTRGRELYWWRKRLGVTFKATRHDLRRTVSTGMVRLGVSVSATDAALGHKVAGVAAHYVHAARVVEAATALWKWDDHLQRLLGRAVSNVVPMVRP